MSLLKIPIILATALAADITITPPNPPPQQDELLSYANSMTDFSKSFSVGALGFAKGSYWAVCMCEVAVILASKFPNHTISKRIIAILHNAVWPNNVRTTRAYLIGSAFVISSALIRSWAYRMLGPLFTVQLSIKREHKLITTGPYRIVRHPAYLGSTLHGIGTTIMCFAPGSIVAECGILNTVLGCRVAYGTMAIHSLLILRIVSRSRVEDEVLRKEFGREWMEWAKKVPYRIIPYVY